MENEPGWDRGGTQCKAKRKGSGKRCRARAVRGREVCRTHGGASPAGGRSHHSYKHGRYSTALPDSFRRTFTEALADPLLTSLRPEIALTDAMVTERLEELGEMPTPAGWRELRTAAARLQTAINTGTAEQQNRTLSKLFDLIDEGERRAAALDEVSTRLENRRKLVDTEMRVQETITQTQFLETLLRISDIITSYVNDPIILRNIVDDVETRILKNAVLIQ